MRLINFGQRKEQILKARAIAERAAYGESDLMDRRRIFAEEIMALVEETAQMFDLSAYKQKAEYSVELINSTLLILNENTTLFDDVELTALQRAFLLAVESRQLLDVVIEQKWRDT